MSIKRISVNTLLYNYSPKLLIFAVILGAVSGALYSMIIPIVLEGINGDNTGPILNEGLDFHNPVYFFVLVFVILLTRASSIILVNNIAKSASVELKLKIVEKINHMKIDHVEKIGFAKLLNVLTDDVNRVSSAAVAIPLVVVSAVTILGMLGYLAYLDLRVFSVVLIAIVFGLVIFQMPISMAKGLYENSRELKDDIQEGVRGLILGSYELKLSKNKSKAYKAEEIVGPQKESLKLEKIGDAIIHLAANSSDLLCFFVIGIVVFVLPNYIEQPQSNLYGIVMALLYITAPFAAILEMSQQLKMGQISLERIARLNHYKDEHEVDQGENLPETWTTFSVRNVSYHYLSKENKQSFSLAPASLSFTKGQVNFIVGGNGSGKSTLSKLLSLHYQPATGDILFDDNKITEKNIHQCRERIAVIFSNYYLFNKIYQEIDHIDLELLDYYLKLLKLKGKTEFVNGRFTTIKLSDGQRRRLALLVALIEDKEVYVFDEWAADQDPQFKALFYTQIIPKMKELNKLVIVITHDDKYFSYADRVINMEDGKVVAIEDICHLQDNISSSAG